MANEAVKLLFFLIDDEMGNNPKGQIVPGIFLPYIGRGGGGFN
ncbi:MULTISPECIES: hypothetical protein [Enterobacteriaceae]|nr:MULTISPECIES: hypothetical protein [Enterobacteriaceae]